MGAEWNSLLRLLTNYKHYRFWELSNCVKFCPCNFECPLFLGVGIFRLFRFSCQLVQLGSICQIVYEFCAKIHKKGISPIELSNECIKLASIFLSLNFNQSINQTNQFVNRQVDYCENLCTKKVKCIQGRNNQSLNRSQSFNSIKRLPINYLFVIK